ncbi:hypothetical protein A3B45_03390 [Candidatus Daviesbacteria bacterium RIFCSPLOWO2_01_FULL_39_12]|uniref:dTDP-4-dehydrorhamnose reductase n=1 Tax=Candidatus Daviesbacteria bacterium RIFCSPLOWO2_01_FULL_39_12 TaxID=1797785 RepID=A0A1F5KSB0_9BACT|nr:MAG: hypothetical protein A3D79_03415 [Candidatus Daviesbacteria bacterium RIFCSPHIGHO2_02_FULL_39_8]OGE43705.1 MAG: hypothetical protein A3B45_03390 [Candidatus Daviesbacteria bacterium RIFCSPLOWO2_01_FULL_39_12]
MKILAFGGNGLVGSRFINLHNQHLDIRSPNTDQVDILGKSETEDVVKSFQPDVVINFAAYTDVQEAEEQKGDQGGSCYQINVIGAKNVAEVCKEVGTYLIQISTDYVFDGQKEDAPYEEEDQPDPKNWYGQTKFWGEQEVLQSGCNFTLVRISMPFSAHHELKKDIARFFLEQLKNGHQIHAITDEKVTPVLVDDVANALHELIKKKSGGIYHVVSTSWTTPFEFANLIAKAFDLDQSLIKPISLDQYNQNKKAKILRYSWLDPTKFTSELGENILHTVEESVNLFKKQVDHDQFT